MMRAVIDEERALVNGTSYTPRNPKNDKTTGSIGPDLIAKLQDLDRQVASMRP